MDAVAIISWQLSRNADEWEPQRIDRPGDASRREAHLKKAREAKKKLENTKWEEVEIG